MNRKLTAAAEGTGDYPVSPEAAIYRHVAIFRTGEFYPAYPPVKVTIDEAYLRELAASYNPQFYCATLNCDHDYWWGPAQGLVLSLSVEDGVLYADLAVTDYWLAQQVDQGQWPARSIEWHDADHAGGELYYGQFAKYLTGLALLGQREPAVPGLGPMPPREADSRDGVLPEPVYYALPLAAARGGQRNVLSFAGGAGEPTTNPEEGEMPNDPKAGAPPELQQELAAEKAEKEKLQARLAELEAGNQATLAAQLNAEKAEKEKLQERVATLEAAEAARAKTTAVEAALAELEAGRYVTPATKPDVRALLEAAHGNQPAWDAALKATKAGGPQYAAGPVVTGDVSDPLAGKSPAFLAAMQATGVTPEQYAQAQQGGQQ